MKIEYDCGCLIQADSDGYGGVDATYLKLCDKHREEYDAKKDRKEEPKISKTKY